MAKEALFNVLNNNLNLEGLNVLDLFSGTGSISFEFASRGAENVTSVDINYRSVAFVNKTANELGFECIKGIRADVFRFLAKTPETSFDLIFSDAPYDLKDTEKIPEMIFDRGWLKKNAWLIVEHSKSIDFTRHRYFIEKRNYGKVNFTFFEQQ